MGAASELKEEAERIADTVSGPERWDSIEDALVAVKKDIGAVGKTGFNKQQGYSFRGVDAVVNAVGPALARHGIVVVPEVLDIQFETYTTKSGTVMRSCVVKTRYTFSLAARHDGGDSRLSCTVYGESSDSGDKSVPKAQSVAYRVALLQALTIPTDDPDPDEHSHERGQAPEVLLPEGWRSEAERKSAWDELRAAKKALTDETVIAEVDAWVVANGLEYGTFTKAKADDLALLLPAEEKKG